MIELSDIRKVFNAGKPNEFVAIQGVSLEICAGGVTVLKGPSGSGKTTLLSLIGCMTRPTSGRITVSGREITSLPERFLTEIRRQTFGFVFQQFHLVKGITVLENVMLPAYPSGLGYSDLRDKASGILHLFGLSGKTASKVEWLSGGEAQRVSISRALINDPAVIIADEPTAHLDSKLSLELMEILGCAEARREDNSDREPRPPCVGIAICRPRSEHPGRSSSGGRREGMIFHPAVISLSAGSLLVSSMLLYSSWFGGGILRKWDLRSGSELQLSLERRTYLISTILSYAFGFQLMSFFLFVFTADHLHILFTGAMCAAGTLNVNEYGYPTIMLKAVNFILVGLWLIMNYTDNKAFDYPLIRKKYAALLILTPFVLAETLLQGAYFLGLRAEVITSCCGSLFSGDSDGVASEIVSLPQRPLMTAFYAVMPATILLGIFSL